ncbi:MAG: hypothetical protein LBE22_08655 [Azoarcus sp.]|jgi:type I restriction enzyme M protein|nr:hypothetical protein [Azoarcus sp.]
MIALESGFLGTFDARRAVEDFSVVVAHDAIAAKNYSLSAGRYFDVKIEYGDITPEQFAEKVNGYSKRLAAMFTESKKLESKIKGGLAGLMLSDGQSQGGKA